METIKFTFQERTIHVHKSGSGPENMLLFHGFGQTGQVFQEWHQALEETHILYSFDLFFHGETEWQLKIKEGLHITWKKPNLNKQIQHVTISLSV